MKIVSGIIMANVYEQSAIKAWNTVKGLAESGRFDKLSQGESDSVYTTLGGGVGIVNTAKGLRCYIPSQTGYKAMTTALRKASRLNPSNKIQILAG